MPTTTCRTTSERSTPKIMHPDDLKTLAVDLARFPFTARRICATTTHVRSVRRCRALEGGSRAYQRHHRQITTVVGYTSNDVDVWTVGAQSIPAPAGGRPGDLVRDLRLRPVHRRPRRALRRRALGCTVVPMSGGFGEKQVQLITDSARRSSWSRRPTAWRWPRDSDRRGIDPLNRRSGRHLRRRAVDQ